MQVNFNGKLYVTSEARRELETAFSQAMHVEDLENNQVSGLNTQELTSLKELVNKYLQSDDTQDVKVAQQYSDFLNELQEAEEEYRASKDFKKDQAREEKRLEQLAKDASGKKSFYENMEESVSKALKGAEYKAPVVNKDFLQDMQGYYENEMKRSELSKENVISSKIYYEHYDNNPAKQIRSFDLGGKTYYEVDEE